MPYRNPCRLYIHFAFTYSVGPSCVVWSESGPAPPFPPTIVLEVHLSWALSPVCEVVLKPEILKWGVEPTHVPKQNDLASKCQNWQWVRVYTRITIFSLFDSGFSIGCVELTYNVYGIQCHLLFIITRHSIPIYYRSHFLPTKVKLVVWTL